MHERMPIGIGIALAESCVKILGVSGATVQRLRGSAVGVRRGPNRNNDSTQPYKLSSGDLSERARRVKPGLCRLGAPVRIHASSQAFLNARGRN